MDSCMMDAVKRTLTLAQASCHVDDWRRWADGWMSGSDRSSSAAWDAAQMFTQSPLAGWASQAAWGLSRYTEVTDETEKERMLEVVKFSMGYADKLIKDGRISKVGSDAQA